jgi:hypothetical protein
MLRISYWNFASLQVTTLTMYRLVFITFCNLKIFFFRIKDHWSSGVKDTFCVYWYFSIRPDTKYEHNATPTDMIGRWHQLLNSCLVSVSTWILVALAFHFEMLTGICPLSIDENLVADSHSILLLGRAYLDSRSIRPNMAAIFSV